MELTKFKNDYKNISTEKLKQILDTLNQEEINDLNSIKIEEIKKVISTRSALITAHMIADFIEETLCENSNESSIDEIDFLFKNKYECYKNKAFKEILDNRLKEYNVKYECTEVKRHVAHFRLIA